MIFKYDEELPIVVTLLVTYALCCAVLALVFQVSSVLHLIVTPSLRVLVR